MGVVDKFRDKRASLLCSQSPSQQLTTFIAAFVEGAATFRRVWEANERLCAASSDLIFPKGQRSFSLDACPNFKRALI